MICSLSFATHINSAAKIQAASRIPRLGQSRQTFTACSASSGFPSHIKESMLASLSLRVSLHYLAGFYNKKNPMHKNILRSISTAHLILNQADYGSRLNKSFSIGRIMILPPHPCFRRMLLWENAVSRRRLCVSTRLIGALPFCAVGKWRRHQTSSTR